MRRYVADDLVSTDKSGRVLLAEVQRVAARPQKHGRRVADFHDRRQGSRVLAHVLRVLHRSRDSSRAATMFVAGAHTEAWRRLPDVPSLERDLAVLPRAVILFLTARFVREYSLVDTSNPARWVQPTKRELREAQVTGGRRVFLIPGQGLLLESTGLSQQDGEAIASTLYETKLSRRLRGTSQSLYEPRARKRGYTLAFLMGWSRQRCNYWRRQTDQVWPSFRKFCAEQVTQGVTRKPVTVVGETDAETIAEMFSDYRPERTTST